MEIIKNQKVHETSDVYVIKNNSVKSITDIYSIVKGKTVLVWTSIKDFVSGVFSAGYWMSDEGWNNEDAWKNQP